MNSQMKSKAAIYELLRSAEKIQAKAKEKWPISASSSADDLSVHAMLLGDARDHVEIACELQRGDLGAAQKIAWKLDTGSREELSPLWVADYLGFELCPVKGSAPEEQFDLDKYKGLLAGEESA
jgi:hypothetical protein